MKVVSPFLFLLVFVLNAVPAFAQSSLSTSAIGEISAGATTTAATAATTADATVVTTTATPSSDSSQTSVVAQSTSLLGQDLTVQHADGITSTQQGVTSATQIKLLGQTSTVMQATLEQIPAPSPAAVSSGATTIDTSTLGADAIAAASAASSMYVAGKRVWTGTFTQQGQSLVYNGGIAPTQIPIPLVLYPVGPLILEVDAGIDYVANLAVSLTPPAGILSIVSPSPSPASTLSTAFSVASAVSAVVSDFTTPSADPISSASLNVSATGSAYVEGYARLLIVRAGVGGAVNVIEGQAAVAAEFFQATAPELQYNGAITLLSGHIYGFVDTNLLISWTRIWSHDFFNWPGKCFAFGGDVCGLN